jgi:IS605 OrfB family transposase
MAPTQAMRTIRQQITHRPVVSEWFTTTQHLYNAVVRHFFEVLQAHPGVLDLSEKDALKALERLTHQTKANPNPVMPLSEIAPQVPAMLRRAAIHAALGSARSFQSHLARWRAAKAKAAARGKPFHLRPPVPPRRWNRSVTLYQGMWKCKTKTRIVLKLYDGTSWRWVRFDLSAQDIPEGWERGSPQIVRKGKRWWLHTPLTHAMERPKKVETQVRLNPEVRLCSVDLNITHALAVATILDANGTALATTFIHGGKVLHDRRRRQLGRIARNRRRTGIIEAGVQDNQARWEKIRHLDEDTAHRVSRRLVDFAVAHGASLLVFEHLGHFRPQQGSYSKRGNEKRAYWLRGKIFTDVRYKAWNQGIVTCRVSPRDTSRHCAQCGALVARYDEAHPAAGYTPGAPLFLCTNPDCRKQGNADRNAAENIGKRLLSRYAT